MHSGLEQFPVLDRSVARSQARALAPRCAIVAVAVLVSSILVACSPATFPLRISDISVFPQPIVGTQSRMSVEVVSSQDEPDVTVTADLPKGIVLVRGDSEWRGSLSAHKPIRLSLDICVVYPGDWRIVVIARSYHSASRVYTDVETVRIHSEFDSGQYTMGRDYTQTQRPDHLLPTELPDSPPPSVCS
jgi:hypothetical protein